MQVVVKKTLKKKGKNVIWGGPLMEQDRSHANGCVTNNGGKEIRSDSPEEEEINDKI